MPARKENYDESERRGPRAASKVGPTQFSSDVFWRQGQAEKVGQLEPCLQDGGFVCYAIDDVFEKRRRSWEIKEYLEVYREKQSWLWKGRVGELGGSVVRQVNAGTVCSRLLLVLERQAYREDTNRICIEEVRMDC